MNKKQPALNEGIHCFRRVNYFSGQLLTVSDFEQETEYMNGKRQLHNRFLHGAGIVSGLEVTCDDANGGTIHVEPGLALDCLGREICVSERVEWPLPPDSAGSYVCIRYAERGIESAPVAGGTSGETDLVQPGLIEEGFEIVLQTANPFLGHSHQRGLRTACGQDHPIPLTRIRKRR